MLTCPNCGAENRYEAIFCRGCGKKLEIIDELTVENIEEKTGAKRRRRKKDKSELTPKQLHRRSIIKNSIRIAVILLVAFAVYLTQQTPSVSAIPTSEGSRKSFVQKKRELRAGGTVTVSEKELNSYVAGLLSGMKGSKAVKFENVQIALGNKKDKEEIAVRMYVRLFGKRTLFQLFGKLKQTGGHIKFSPTTFAKVGKLPYPAFVMKWHCKNVLSDLKSDTDFFNKLTEATIKDVELKSYVATVSTGSDRFRDRLDQQGCEWEEEGGNKIKIFVTDKEGTGKISSAAREAGIVTPRLSAGKSEARTRIVLKTAGKS